MQRVSVRCGSAPKLGTPPPPTTICRGLVCQCASVSAVAQVRAFRGAFSGRRVLTLVPVTGRLLAYFFFVGAFRDPVEIYCEVVCYHYEIMQGYFAVSLDWITERTDKKEVSQ